MSAEVEFFTEDIDGVEYLNVGLKWMCDGEELRAVLGAFTGEVDQTALRIIKGLVEEAVGYVQEAEAKAYGWDEDGIILPEEVEG